jgi:hypothetical protein
MNATTAALRDMLPPEQLQQLEAVRRRLLDDPSALDTHSREKRDDQGQQNQKSASEVK